MYYQAYRKPDYIEKGLAVTIKAAVKAALLAGSVMFLFFGGLHALIAGIERIGVWILVLVSSMIGLLVLIVLERAYIRRVAAQTSEIP